MSSNSFFGICVLHCKCFMTALVPVALISPIKASHFFCFYGEISSASVVKVQQPAAILNPASPPPHFLKTVRISQERLVFIVTLIIF